MPKTARSRINPHNKALHIDTMKRAQLVALLDAVRGELYCDGPDTEWSPDTVENIARLLSGVTFNE